MVLSPESLALAARTIRVLTVDACDRAGIGHAGLPLGCAELGSVLFGEVLKHDPGDPHWPDRDRFVLSAGHGSMLLYSLLHLSGYDLPEDQLREFRQLGSRTPGHPEVGVTAGVETTTGPLGQGFGNAVGMALAERILSARFGSELVDHRTYVLASDGDLMEGVASEAASLAGHLGLGRLIVFYDDNGITIDGPTSLCFSEDVPARFRAYDWNVQIVEDGHDPNALRAAIASAQTDEEKPHLIVCRTEIGRGSPVAGQAKAHGFGMGSDGAQATRTALDWELDPFEVPGAASTAFQPNAERGRSARSEWEKRKRKAHEDPRTAQLWSALYGRSLPDDLEARMPDFVGSDPMATRKASGLVLNALAESVPGLIGGSADLAGSNNTTLDGFDTIARGSFSGRNLFFGIREHAMGGVANGIALHGGLRPYVATFMVFSDYMRPPIRLASLMEQPVAFVFTHDSIFVGEDGPTHQPVEQLAALRAIPNLETWRPGDAREVAAAWTRALRREDGPVALALTRQNLPALDAEAIESRALRGGYEVVAAAEGEPDLVIVATGSEVQHAVAAARALNSEGRSVRAVSIPCLEVFLAQDAGYRESVLGTAPRLVVEAGVALGLAQVIRPGDRFHGMDGFGASAPYQVLGEHFGFTTENVLGLARELLG